MSTPIDYQILLDKCGGIIDDIEALYFDYYEFLTENELEVPDIIYGSPMKPFEFARKKLSSEQLNIIVIGAFSSGKSFLISGFMNRLTWFEAHGEYFDDREDDYKSFLPSSPEQTSSCPLEIIPITDEQQATSRLEVFFADTDNWEDKTEIAFQDNYQKNEDDIMKKMMMYVTEMEEVQKTRPNDDLGRKVKRARLHVQGMPLPAILHDLPGIGGIGTAQYTDTVHKAVRSADCIIYVASAVKELTETELELLRFVEEASTSNRMPVFFVLSQIDREREYEKVLARNNAFLAQYFRDKEDRPNRRFIRDGFIPLSPALEAKAIGLHGRNMISKDKRDAAIVGSGMPKFRKTLAEFLETTSGPAHLRELVLLQRQWLDSLLSSIDNKLRSEATPLDTAQGQLREIEDFSKSLERKKRALSDSLDERGEYAIYEAFSRSDPDDLTSYLVEHLEEEINSSNLLKEEVRHKIEQEKRRLRDEWLNRPNDGFVDSWVNAMDTYQTRTVTIFNELLKQALEEADISEPSRLIPSDAAINGRIAVPEGTDISSQIDMMNGLLKLAMGVTSITGLTGAGGAGISALVGASALGPFGLALIAAGAVAGTAGLGMTRFASSERKRLRARYLEDLNVYAKQTIAAYRTQAEQFLAAYKGEVLRKITELIRLQAEQRETIERRMKEGDLNEHEHRVFDLQNMKRNAESVKKEIETFFRLVSQ